MYLYTHKYGTHIYIHTIYVYIFIYVNVERAKEGERDLAIRDNVFDEQEPPPRPQHPQNLPNHATSHVRHCHATNPQPHTLNPQPSSLTLTPSTLNLQPTTLSPEGGPSTLNPQSSIRWFAGLAPQIVQNKFMGSTLRTCRHVQELLMREEGSG